MKRLPDPGPGPLRRGDEGLRGFLKPEQLDRSTRSCSSSAGRRDARTERRQVAQADRRPGQEGGRARGSSPEPAEGQSIRPRRATPRPPAKLQAIRKEADAQAFALLTKPAEEDLGGDDRGSIRATEEPRSTRQGPMSPHSEPIRPRTGRGPAPQRSRDAAARSRRRAARPWRSGDGRSGLAGRGRRRRVLADPGQVGQQRLGRRVFQPARERHGVGRGPEVGQVGQERGLAGPGRRSGGSGPRPRTRGSRGASSGGRSGATPAGRGRATSRRRGRAGSRPRCSGFTPVAVGGPLEIFGQPLVEPERDVADGDVEQGVGRLVADVLFEPVAEEGVDDPLVAVGQEERPAMREVGVVEGQEVVERLAVVEDVDLDRVLAGVDPEPERSWTWVSSDWSWRTTGASASSRSLVQMT